MQHRSPLHARRAAAGFTIIEVMVTVTLASILLGIAIPSFRGMIASNRIVTQSNDFVGAINFARSEAITRNTNVTLCRTATAADTNCAGSTEAWVNWIVRNAGGVIRSGTVPTYGGTVSVNSDLANDTIIFSSDGLARSNGDLVSDLSFTVCSSASSTDNKRQVMLGAGSRISTTKSSGSC